MDFFFNQERNSSSVSRKRHGRRWLSEKLNFSFILRQSSKFGGKRLELKGREKRSKRSFFLLNACDPNARPPFFIEKDWTVLSNFLRNWVETSSQYLASDFGSPQKHFSAKFGAKQISCHWNKPIKIGIWLRKLTFEIFFVPKTTHI